MTEDDVRRIVREEIEAVLVGERAETEAKITGAAELLMARILPLQTAFRNLKSRSW